MKNFRELKVWEKAHRLVLAVYKATVRFPDQERYGLYQSNPPGHCFHCGQHRRGLRKRG